MICYTLLLVSLLVSSSFAGEGEILILDWNGVSVVGDVTTHIPREAPPRAEANGNWLTPVNYTTGTLYMRLEIRSMPVPDHVYPQFCIWQKGVDGTNYAHEICISYPNMVGTGAMGNPGTIKKWSHPMSHFSVNKAPIDFDRPREQYGYGIKTLMNPPDHFQLVSHIKGYNWSGEDPNSWYPLDHRFTVVIVAEGYEFSGWANYIEGEAVDISQKRSAYPGIDLAMDGSHTYLTDMRGRRLPLHAGRYTPVSGVYLQVYRSGNSDAVRRMVNSSR